MIPKVIHYCWFGGKPLSDLAKQCIHSWKVYFPDYEIMEWNEANFDVNSIKYIREAYQAKKYAFVSDYARYKILNEYGGVYFDVDVEVIKDMRWILQLGPYMGCQKDSTASNATFDAHDLLVNPGLGFAAEPNMPFVREILSFYEEQSFVRHDGSLNLETIVTYTTELLVNYGLINTPNLQNIAGFNIFPKVYFNPREPDGRIIISDKTHSIHHFDASWQSKSDKFKLKLVHLVLRIFGTENIKRLLKAIGIR